MRSRLLAVTTALLLIGSVLIGGPAHAATAAKPKPAPDPGNNTPAKLTRAVTTFGILRHLGAFQYVAHRFADTRASGTPGHDHSASYVERTMRRAGYHVTTQEFDFQYCDSVGSAFAQTAPGPTPYVEGAHYSVMTCAGPGDTTAAVVPVDLTLAEPRTAVTSGCESTDFDGVPVAGRIALLQRGGCTFAVKAHNAIGAGAVAVIVMNQGDGTPAANPDRYDLFGGNLGAPVDVPVIAVSFTFGRDLAAASGLTVRLAADTVAETRTTRNVIAETPDGDADRVVMLGSHLDSVTDGPGLNDNGSGSAALLEVAWQMRKVHPANKVRFAWWGGEASGLLGSTTYVNQLTADQVARIRLYLNVDTIASPNYTLGVYDGDDSDRAGAGAGPAGSAEIEATFQRFFADRGLPTKGADLTGHSDHGPFTAVGVPAGGLFTGTGTTKTADDVTKWGGVAGAPMDPCHRAFCDSLTPLAHGADPALYADLDRRYWLAGNLNLVALDVNADAIASAAATYAADVSSLPARSAPDALAAPGNVLPAYST